MDRECDGSFHEDCNEGDGNIHEIWSHDRHRLGRWLEFVESGTHGGKTESDVGNTRGGEVDNPRLSAKQVGLQCSVLAGGGG